MGFAAINAENHAGSDSRITESVEAQESRTADAYAAGLQFAEMGRRTEAQAVFEGLLHEALLHDGSKHASISAASAAQLRYLVLKNLASLLAAEDASAPRALSLYAQALMLDDGDSVVWNHMGTLAAELGRWGVARTVFEHGLRRHPGRHIMAEKLAEVVMQLGDWQAAQPILARMLAQDSAHPRALQLSKLAKAAASSLPHQGNVLEAYASPFRKRVPAAGPSTQRQAGTTVLSAPSATWSAVLCAVTSALRAPRALPAGQVMHSVRVTVPPEHRQPVLAIESPNVDRDEEATTMSEACPLTEGIPVSAPHGAEHVAGAAAAQAPGTEVLPLQPLDPDVGVQLTQDGDSSQKLGHAPGHAPQKTSRDSGEPEKAAPARASRRLEARREGGPEADAEVEAGEVNILALLSPFMTRQFPSRQGTPLAAPHAQSAAPASAVPATPSGQERAAEERAVRAYIAASGEAPSAMAAGATLLCAVVQQKGQPWPRDLAKQTLSLAAVLRPSWKAKGEGALTLAEMCMDATEDASTGRGASLQLQQENLHAGTAQVGGELAHTGGERKTKAALKRRGAQHPTVAKLRTDCEEYLGHYLMSRLRGQSDMPEELQEACAIRHQWLLARSAELRRDFWAAGRHYSVCQELCAEAEAKHARSWSVALPHCSGAPAITASAAKAKADGLKAYQVLESAKAHLEGGRADQVIAELGPMLLSEASVQGQGAFTTKQCILEGLQLLQDAAVTQKDVACELKCRLVALQWLLPQVPTDFDDDNAHTAPASGPPPAAMRDLQAPFKAIVTQAMTDLADFVAMHTRAGAVSLLAQAVQEQSKLLQLLQWQAAVLMERAFWSLCKSLQPAANTPGRSSASKTAARQATLLAACLGFCAMQQLQVLVQPCSPGTVRAQVDMLSAVCNILAQQELLGLQRGAFIRLALGRFSDFLQLLKDLPADAVPEEAAKEKLEKLVDSNLARCLQLLFGVTLPHRNLDWAATAEEVAGGPSLRSPQECQEVWRYLSPYAEGMEGDSKMLSRLQGVLESIQQHFRAPPAAVLEAWDPVKLLDSTPFDKADIYSSANISMVNQVLQQPAALHAAVASDEHANIHRSLHRLLDTLKPDLDSAVKFGEGLIFEEEGARVVDRQAQLAVFDLRYTPRSLRSWDSLASTYSEAASDILNEAARDFSVAQFRSNEGLRARFELYQRRALWATLVARQVAADADMADDVPNLDEQIGNILYEDLQNAPPLCDQLSTGLEAPVRETLIRNAAEAYARAKTGLPDEWVYSCYHGKLQSKLGLPPEEWLPSMAKAVQLSVLHSGGMLEPFYQLHAQRLKLLLFNAAPTVTCLTAIARYCCMEETAQAAVAAMAQAGAASTGNPLHGQTSEDTISRVRHILMLDCDSAMRFCLDMDKRYHKAAFQIGRARAAQGRTEEAMRELQDLFSNARLKFCINIWEIQGGPEAKSCNISETVEAASDDSVEVHIDDLHWGRKPASIAGNGMDETFRKFAACRRRYMLLYFKLLQATGRFDLLLAAHAFLQSSAHWQNADIMADMAEIALVRCVVEMAGRLHASRQSLSRPTSAPEPQGPAAEDLNEAFLQVCCTLYTEHLAGTEQPLDVGTIARVLPDTRTVAAAWALGEGFQHAAQCCISRLGVQEELGKLQELLAGLRKRFKALRSAPQEAQALAKLLAATMAHAISRSLTRHGAEPYCSQAPSASAPIQATAEEAQLILGPAQAASAVSAPAPGMLGSSPDAPAVSALAAVPSSAQPPPAALAPSGGSIQIQAAEGQPPPATAPAAAVAPALQGLSAHALAWRSTLQGLGLGAANAAALAPLMPPLAVMLHCSAEHRVALLTSVISAFATAEVQKGRDSTQVFQEIQQIQAALQRLMLEPMLLSRTACVQPPPAPGATAGGQAPAAASAASAQQQAAGPSSSQSPFSEAMAPALPQAESSHQPQNGDWQAPIASSSQALVQEGSPTRHAPQQQQLSQSAVAGSGAHAESSAQHQEEIEQDQLAGRPEGSGQRAVDAQQMQQSAKAREEALQLMKHSRNLHKSAIARLPTAPKQDDGVTGGLAMIDTNMIRSYKLYMGLAGRELPPGSTLTAADAAAGYEEVVKSQKQASPTKTGKTARNRPASGGEAAQGMEAGGRSEAEQDREDQQPAKRRRREPS